MIKSSTSSAATYLAAAFAVVLLAATTRVTVVAQSDCAAQLVTCYNYLNSTNPSTQCCEAIKNVVATQLPCLCNLYNNPSVLGGGINMTQALMLPKYCKLPADTSVCSKALAPGASTPPATTGGNNGNNASGIRSSLVGMPALLLVLALISLYY